MKLHIFSGVRPFWPTFVRLYFSTFFLIFLFYRFLVPFCACSVLNLCQLSSKFVFVQCSFILVLSEIKCLRHENLNFDLVPVQLVSRNMQVIYIIFYLLNNSPKIYKIFFFISVIKFLNELLQIGEWFNFLSMPSMVWPHT